MAEYIPTDNFLPSASDGYAESLANPSATFYAKVIALANSLGASEAVAAAAALHPYGLTELTVSGTKAYTLANGTYVGQKKQIECVAASSTPLGTVTIATMTGSRTNVAYVFSTVGARLELEWTATGWRETLLRAAGADAPAAASTLNVLVLNHVIAITDTMDWVLPNGTVPGQRQTITVSANSGSPVGTISGLFYDNADGSADGTDVSLNAAGDFTVLEWDGARWMPFSLVSATT